MPTVGACNCVQGWICEEHPDKRMGHDEKHCGGAGMPCENPKCPHGQRALKRKPIDEAIDREWYPDDVRGD